jgi:hypothetical protein
MVTSMKKFLLLLLLVPALASANAVPLKKVYGVSKNGVIYRNSNYQNTYPANSSLYGTASISGDNVIANRSIAINAPTFETAGLVIDAVQVSKASILDTAKGHFKSGLKSNLYGAAATIVAGIAVQKGWEWLEEQKAWVQNIPTYSEILCYPSGSRPPGISTNAVFFKNNSLQYCTSYYQKQINAISDWQVDKIEHVSIRKPNSTTTDYTGKIYISSKPPNSPMSIVMQVNGTTDSIGNSNKSPVPEPDLDLAVKDAITGKEKDIVEADIRNGLNLPYGEISNFSNAGNQPALSPSTVTSIETKINPDGSTETIQKTQQKKYEYTQPSADTYAPKITTVETEVKTNNKTGEKTETKRETAKSPEEVKEQEKKEEPELPPVPPKSEFPEIKKPELSNEKLPQLVAPTIMGFPTIPTSFSCTNPDFDMGLWKTTLPMCDWIEKFRALFEWFWMMSTAIAIYVIARGTNLHDGK